MTQYYHTDRPTAQQALDQFESIIARQKSISLSWRLRGKDESMIPMLFRDIGFAAQESNRYCMAMVRYGTSSAALDSCHSLI